MHGDGVLRLGPGRAGAQGAPLETVKIVTGFPPGGTSDTLCRRVAEGMKGSAFTKAAIVENKPDGRYAFIFPQRNQAKDTAWRYLKRYAAPLLGAEPSESELRVDLINGAMMGVGGWMSRPAPK